MNSSCPSPTGSFSSTLSGSTLAGDRPETPVSMDISLDQTNDFINAVLTGNIHEVSALASKGIWIPPLDSWVIYEACLQGAQMVQAFCQNPLLDLDQQITGSAGDKTIHLLLRTAPQRFIHGKRNAIVAFLQQSVSPIARDQQGYHALHILARSQHPDDGDIMKLFLCSDLGVPETVRASCVAEINARHWPRSLKSKGDTPLTLAVLWDNIECVRLLLENGADPLLPGVFNQTPLELATAAGHHEIVSMLLDYLTI